MNHFVIGTAGHIDHGKTLLTHALTGVDTDRLPEEKAKGITIELGFAPLKLQNGVQASIVDVPGHEKFVKTMLAGATGMDAALLVVAADDGVMPQTREHLDILKLLHIPTGVIALTKTDLVDEEQLEAVRAEIMELTRGSFLEGAEILPVSALTGAGIPSLLEALTALSDRVQERNSLRPMRLPIDRAFVVSGQGTIITGTLVDGGLQVGDTALLYPQERAVRIRSLQNHGKAQKSVAPGIRTAAALAGVERGEVARGCTLAAPDSMVVTSLVDVCLQITEDCPYRIRNSSQLHLYCGTQEGVARLRLLDRDFLSAGQEGFAQLKLNTPMAFRNGDRFIVRFFSPVVTVGGGTILDASAQRRRRNHSPVLERLAHLQEGGSARLLQQITDTGCTGVPGARLAVLDNLCPEELASLTRPLVEGGQVLTLEGQLLAASAYAQRLMEVQQALTLWHRDYPLMEGMPLAQLRSQCFAKGDATQSLLRHMAEEGSLTLTEGQVALPDFAPVFTQQHKIMQRKLLHHYRDAWFRAPDRKDVDAKFTARGELYPQVFRHMLYHRMLVPLTPRYAVHHEAYAQAVALLKELATHEKGVTLGQFRTATDTSRKYAQLFLEHWDSTGLTRRVGDAHILNE